jgi:hypothetical protein
MYTRLGRSKRLIPAVLGGVTLAGVAVLLSLDALPNLFPSGSHEILAAFSLATIALAYLVYQIAHRPAAMELLKALMLAVAFLFCYIEISGFPAPPAELYRRAFLVHHPCDRQHTRRMYNDSQTGIRSWRKSSTAAPMHWLA